MDSLVGKAPAQDKIGTDLKKPKRVSVLLTFMTSERPHVADSSLSQLAT
jgi:hypothetical protein